MKTKYNILALLGVGLVIMLSIPDGKGVPTNPITLDNPLEVNFRIHQGAVLLSFDSDASKYYQFEFSADMVNWNREGYSFKGTGGHMSIAVSGRGYDSAYYRLRDDGDPKNILTANPSRTWVSETGNRSYGNVYNNTAPYEICLFVSVGIGSNPVNNYEQRPAVQARKDESSEWISAGATTTANDILVAQGYITAIIPAGWQYRLDDDVPVNIWNELK